MARSSADWQQLLRLCRITDVLVADEVAVYDPGQADDRLLLDLKGTMSEAELQWLGLRLVGARRNKARRGELRFVGATGYVWEGSGSARTRTPRSRPPSRRCSIGSRWSPAPGRW